MKCMNCGVELKGGDSFCSKCGAHMRPEKYPQCGTSQRDDAKYYGACGIPIMRDNSSVFSTMSIIFAFVTFVIWIVERYSSDVPKEAAFLAYLPMIFCSLCVGSGCVALGKGRWSGLIGIVMLIVFALILGFRTYRIQ